MSLKLMYITNKEDIAKIAEDSGVDWIFIDLEINGKEERQGFLDTVISRHNIEDVKKISQVLTKSKLIVRINPINDGSKDEINQVIYYGCDIIMLPFFKTKEEVKTFIEIVDGRVEVCILLETPEAVENIDSILAVQGINYIHIGLNDLYLGYKMKFMFEPLANGIVDEICKKIKEENIQYGFGGIARLGFGTLPSEYIISEHYRLDSSMAILSRSFCNTNSVTDLDEVKKIFVSGIDEIRKLEDDFEKESDEFFQLNHIKVSEKVQLIINSL
jgi:2-keto-3-deoxy-L-rhamnonate aldolase RhmA